MDKVQRFYVEKNSLFGWVYYIDDPASEKFPATSKQRAIDAAIEAAKAAIAQGEFAEVHLNDSADGWHVAWPASVAQLSGKRGQRDASGRSR